MQPQASRDFQRAALQRLSTAEYLHRGGFNLDAQYLGGYSVECALKALILHLTPDKDKPATLSRISSGAAMHRLEVLKAVLAEFGVAIPLAISLRLLKFQWKTDLRYESGRRDSGETVAFLKTAKLVFQWVEEQLQ